MEDCIFCKIINGEIPSEKVYEDEEILAFKDINPAAPVHILVIPKKHIKSLLEVNEEDSKIIAKIYEVINKIVKDMKMEEDGFRVIVNCGKQPCIVCGNGWRRSVLRTTMILNIF